MYIGIDIVLGNKVYWDLQSSPSPHTLIVGSTGSGKTVALLTLAQRAKDTYGCSITVLDIKDEYRYLIETLFDDDFTLINPLVEPIPLCYCDDNVREKAMMVFNVVKSVSKVFSIPTPISKTLYNTLLDICNRCINIDNILTLAYEYQDRSVQQAIDTISEVFSVYPNARSYTINLMPLNGVRIINLKPLFLKNRAGSATLITYIVNTLLSSAETSLSSTPSSILILDELWHVIPYIAEDLIDLLARYSRGLGLAIFMATQNIDDLNPYTDSIVNNCGGFIAMATSSLSYWQRVKRYLNLSSRSIEYAMGMGVQGEAVARFYPYRTPIFMYIDPFSNY